jgi:mannose-6-phosphate isomerase-like protein (cupin superfamily)
MGEAVDGLAGPPRRGRPGIACGGQDPAEIGARGAQPRSSDRRDVIVERIDDEPVRDLPLVLGRATGENQASGLLARGDRLAEQRGLADSRLPEHHHGPARARAHVHDDSPERLQLGFPTHEAHRPVTLTGKRGAWDSRGSRAGIPPYSGRLAPDKLTGMQDANTFHTNPSTGERIRWLLRAADTGGELVRLEMWTSPGGGVRGTHVHARSEERFEVLSGRLVLESADDVRVLLPGEQAAVPAGTPHQWRNGGADELHMIVELDRPGRFEQMLEASFAAGRNGHFDERGRMRPLAAAALVQRYPDEIARRGRVGCAGS